MQKAIPVKRMARYAVVKNLTSLLQLLLLAFLHLLTVSRLDDLVTTSD